MRFLANGGRVGGTLKLYCAAVAFTAVTACNNDQGCKGSLRAVLPADGTGLSNGVGLSKLEAHIEGLSAVCVVVHTPVIRNKDELLPPRTTYRLPVTATVRYSFGNSEAAQQQYGGTDPSASVIVEALAANGTVVSSQEGVVTMPTGGYQAKTTVSLDNLTGAEMALVHSVSARWIYGHHP